jgi:hypothetical protein
VLEATMQGPYSGSHRQTAIRAQLAPSIDDVDGQPARFSPRHGASRRDTDDCYVLSIGVQDSASSASHGVPTGRERGAAQGPRCLSCRRLARQATAANATMRAAITAQWPNVRVLGAPVVMVSSAA